MSNGPGTMRTNLSLFFWIPERGNDDGVGGGGYPCTTVLLAIVYAQGSLWLMQEYDYMIGW